MTRSYDTEGLVEACGAATLEERHQLLTMMLDAVYGCLLYTSDAADE